MPHFDRPLSPGREGTRKTLVTMQALVCLGARSVKVWQIVRWARRRFGSGFQLAAALFRYVQRRIRYMPDPPDIEQVQSAPATLRIRQGDCDDHTVLLSALLLRAGFPVRITVVRGANRKEFHHVFPEAQINGEWFPFDSSDEDAEPGKLTRSYAEKVSHKVQCPIGKYIRNTRRRFRQYPRTSRRYTNLKR